MNTGKFLLRVLPALVLSIILVGCGGSSNPQVSNPPIPQLSITSPGALPTGDVNGAYQASLAASGGTAPYTWSILSGSLPSGLSLSGSGAISGAPTAGGVSSFTVQVTDAEASPQTASAAMSITIYTLLGATTSSLPNGIVTENYSANLAAAGGLPPYSWTITSGTLPAGLSLSASGAITGMPSADGTSSFTVKVADAETTPQTASAHLSIITVNALIVSTSSLAVGTANLGYVDNLVASGGTIPYAWSITSGTLPAGLRLSSGGIISGTPTTLGTTTFTAHISDAEQPPQQATVQLSLSVITSMQVTTHHYDNFRSGQNPVETVLTPANVNTNQFGELFSYAVDGKLFGQPLYLANVNIPGNGTHNVIYVATEHDSVYAFDADSNSGQNANPLWQVSFIDPAHGITPVSSTDVNCDDISPEIGITSTPVIDTGTGTIYVLARTKENGTFVQRLHALDVTTGAEKFGGPTVIQATYPGTGSGSSGGMLTFDPLLNNNRTGLLLKNGMVYLAWASHCDNGIYHGWLIAYDKSTLQQTAVWVPTPNGSNGGLWMSGAGLSADLAGDLFIPTANGTFDTSGTPVDFGDSIVRLEQNGSQFTVLDYFTPYNQGNLEEGDIDVGSGGALLLPDQSRSHVHELVQVGKEGSLYVVDRDRMGQYNPTDNSQIVQYITGQVGIELGIPAYWNKMVYLSSGGQFPLEAFSVANGLLSDTPVSQTSAFLGFVTPVVSSNGNNNGIVWALQNVNGYNNGHEVLRAYDATNLGNELYDSRQNQQRDDPGLEVKFAVPAIANGKVYVGSANQLSVYGLLGQH